MKNPNIPFLRTTRKIIHENTVVKVLITPDIAVSLTLSIPLAYVGSH